MTMNMLPDSYRQIDNEKLKSKITHHKKSYGSKLVILGHHYQKDEVIEFADHRGDSFGLSKIASGAKEAEFIVFCGVHFMAEAAVILSRPDQRVFLPDHFAGCPMADMANINQVEDAWAELTKVHGPDEITPITYINSHADLKAFCGQNGGAVCTSSNAHSIMEWAFSQRPRIFFFPDQHLGRNTANTMGIAKEKMIIWDPRKEKGGNTDKDIEKAKVILWRGHCHVHTWFNTRHVEAVRKKSPNAKIIVHPECIEEVVRLCDANGSTGFIVQYVQDARPGAEIYIGTEANLVMRLAKENPDKKIYPLNYSVCPNMYKINLQNLCFTLDKLGEVNEIEVDQDIARHAKVALDRMLKCKDGAPKGD